MFVTKVCPAGCRVTLGRIKMFSMFIFLCLQNMVSGQQVEYINLSCRSHPEDLYIGPSLRKISVNLSQGTNRHFCISTISLSVFWWKDEGGHNEGGFVTTNIDVVGGIEGDGRYVFYEVYEIDSRFHK